jgi:hypothetical protein
MQLDLLCRELSLRLSQLPQPALVLNLGGVLTQLLQSGV